MIKKLHIQPIITLAVLIFLTGCGSENHIRTKLTNIDKQQLAIDLDKMKNAATEMGSIAREEWPATVLALEPIGVSVDDEGVYIKVWQSFVSEDGLFFLDPASSFKPDPGGDPSYEHIEDRFYYYYIAG